MELSMKSRVHISAQNPPLSELGGRAKSKFGASKRVRSIVRMWASSTGVVIPRFSSAILTVMIVTVNTVNV